MVKPTGRHDVSPSSAGLREEELRYLASQLAKTHPAIAELLMRGTAEGKSWTDVYASMIRKLKQMEQDEIANEG